MEGNEVLMILKKIVKGIIHGLFMWLIYVLTIPFIVNSLTTAEIFTVPTFFELKWFLIMLFFIIIFAVASALKHRPYGVLLNVFGNLLAFLVLVKLLEGGLVTISVPVGEGIEVYVFMDLRIVLYTIFIVITIPSIMISVYESLKEIDEHI
ncbi:MAG TPA: hypothetical protein ENG05_00695 [Acidilobales archaeon]|nr:MAG: hypothetical protein B6U85_06830 [Desulfurococcales archaeon ex4484_42]HDN75630.1 hypothetical protein [Acidilobales archaeon]